MWRTLGRRRFAWWCAFSAWPCAVACSEGDPAKPSFSASAQEGNGYSTADFDANADAIGDSNAFQAAEAGQTSGPDVGDAGCPRDLPQSCPSPPPSWMNDVQSIFVQACYGCHGAGGIEQSAFDFSTYAGVHKSFGSILSNVYNCAMPPHDASALTAAQRQVLLSWLVCTAPNN